MASSSTHEKLCEPCQQKKLKVKVRSFCFECQELLCKECSDIHLTFKFSRNHNIIDLIPLSKQSIKNVQSIPESTHDDHSADKSSDVVDDELSSDFLEHITLTKDTILYGAQVAVNHTVARTSDSTGITIDPKRMKASKILDFETLQEGDSMTLRVTGAIFLSSNKVIIVATDEKLKFFDKDGQYLSSNILHVVKHVFAITLVRRNTFAVCGSVSKVQLCTYDDGLQEGAQFDVDHLSHGISSNGIYYGVLHRNDRVITILDNKGTKVRKIDVSDVDGKKLNLGSDIHLDRATNDIYIPLQQTGILCLSLKGEKLWMKPLPDTYTLWGIVEVHNVLCIAHDTNKCLELMEKSGVYLGPFVGEKEMETNPYKIFFCEQSNQLFVTYCQRNAKENAYKCPVTIFTCTTEN